MRAHCRGRELRGPPRHPLFWLLPPLSPSGPPSLSRMAPLGPFALKSLAS
jgi:hypothetical protein